MKNKLSIILLLLIIITTLSCNYLIDSKVDDLPTYGFVLKDSIVVRQVGALLFADYNSRRETCLFWDYSNAKIVETSIKGEILGQFSLNDEGIAYGGKGITNLGYYRDSLLILINRGGYFFLDRKGKILDRIKDEVIFSGNGMNLKLGVVNNIDNEILISTFKLSYDPSQLKPTADASSVRNRELHENYKALTFLDLKSKKSDLKIPYEQGSIHKEYKYYYEQNSIYFDYNIYDSKLYVIHNPEEKIWIYDSNGDSLKNIISLGLDYFKQPILSPFDRDPDYDSRKILSVNSEFKSIHSFGDTVLISYNAGIPENKYKKVDNSAELVPLWAKYGKYYTHLLINGKKVALDTETPYEVTGIAYAHSLNHIIMNTWETRIERPDYSVFFIYKLVKLK